MWAVPAPKVVAPLQRDTLPGRLGEHKASQSAEGDLVLPVDRVWREIDGEARKPVVFRERPLQL